MDRAELISHATWIAAAIRVHKQGNAAPTRVLKRALHRRAELLEYIRKVPPRYRSLAVRVAKDLQRIKEGAEVHNKWLFGK
jgi:hypothetical protein